jgi:Flp pilus assembly pilin Flp
VTERGVGVLGVCAGINEATRMNPILANLRSLIPDFLSDDRSARSIEFGLLAVGIVVACVATAAALGTGLEPDGGFHRLH